MRNLVKALARLAFLVIIISIPGHDVQSGGPPPPITFDPMLRQLHFGTVMKPSSGTVKVVVKRNGNINNGATTATMLDTALVSDGNIRIRGSSDDKIDISFSDEGNVAGLTITEFDARYGGKNFKNSKTKLKAPRPAGRVLDFGGTLQISNSVASGTHYPGFMIEAVYN